MLWANMHLLFWLSLVPFVTGWMGENPLAPAPAALYGVVLLMAAVAYYILQRAIIHTQGRDSLLARAIGRDCKGKASPLLYLVALPAAFVEPWIALRRCTWSSRHVAGARPAHRAGHSACR